MFYSTCVGAFLCAANCILWNSVSMSYSFRAWYTIQLVVRCLSHPFGRAIFMLQALPVALRACHLFLVRRGVGVIMNVLALLRSAITGGWTPASLLPMAYGASGPLSHKHYCGCYGYWLLWLVVGSTAVAYVFSITSTLPICFHLLILILRCDFLWDSISSLSTLILIFYLSRGFVFCIFEINYILAYAQPQLTLFVCFDLLTRFIVAVSTWFFSLRIVQFYDMYFCNMHYCYRRVVLRLIC